MRAKEAAGSNRTFMELKYTQQMPYLWAKKSSNRTFMELKYAQMIEALEDLKF